MKKTSLSFKIIASVFFSSTLTLLFLYLSFSSLFEKNLIKVEQQKAQLLAETIEPDIAVNYFLGLEKEIENLGEKISNKQEVLYLEIKIENQTIWQTSISNKEHKAIKVNYPITNTADKKIIGEINLHYSLDDYSLMIEVIAQEIETYLFWLFLWFLSFVFITRLLLKPLGLLAKQMDNYVPGEKANLDAIRMEPEIQAISDSFSTMVDKIRDYNQLLEQYKISVDESSIVSKMNPEGQVIYANDEFCKISGYKQKDLHELLCWKLLHPEVASELTEEIRANIDHHKIWKGLIKHQAKSGKTYFARSTIVPLLGEDKKLVEFMNVQQDITQIIEQSEQISRQTTDPVTGLPNRVKFMEDCKTLTGAKVAIIAIDNYKIIKDFYGYNAREEVLKQMSIIFNNSLDTNTMTLYKLGGGDFALLVDQTVSLDQFKQHCRLIKENIESHPVYYDSNTIDLNIVIGISINQVNLLSYSALALQYASEHKIAMLVYEEQQSLKQRLENNILWTKKIKLAIKENRFTLFVQPIVDSITLQTVKYECLVRMIDEEGEIISPYFFLGVAKNSLLYPQISRTVIQQAFENFSRIPDVSFSINLSPEDILNPTTIELCEDLLDKYQIASRVVIEIVESEEISDFEQIKDFILKMKNKGCKIAVDDFGSGYSNFSYLLQLNVDFIKVDGSIIRDMHENPCSQIIANTIINFSSELKIQTIAEFVHNDKVMEKAQKSGFNYLQGYHLGEPIPINDLHKKFIN